MMGVTRVGIRDAYYVAMRENTNVWCRRLLRARSSVSFNDTIDGSQTCEFCDSNRQFSNNVSIRSRILEHLYIDNFSKKNRQKKHV